MVIKVNPLCRLCWFKGIPRLLWQMRWDQSTGVGCHHDSFHFSQNQLRDETRDELGGVCDKEFSIHASAIRTANSSYFLACA